MKLYRNPQIGDFLFFRFGMLIDPRFLDKLEQGGMTFEERLGAIKDGM